MEALEPRAGDPGVHPLTSPPREVVAQVCPQSQTWRRGAAGTGRERGLPVASDLWSPHTLPPLFLLSLKRHPAEGLVLGKTQEREAGVAGRTEEQESRQGPEGGKGKEPEERGQRPVQKPEGEEESGGEHAEETGLVRQPVLRRSRGRQIR